MRGAPLHVYIEAAVFLVLCLIALGSFGYAVWKWRMGTETKRLPVWRQVATILAFLAVATQVGVIAVYWIWPQIGRDYIMFGQWARWVASYSVCSPVCLLLPHYSQCLNFVRLTPGRITGKVRSSTHFSGYRVYQDLAQD
jgi:hypothetical protein